jgi:hypothetical protein
MSTAKKNVLEATIEAIAESDNEIGGMIVTRLRESHRHGGGNGYLRAASPGVLQTKTEAFRAGDVGKLADVLDCDPSTGNRGTYRIATYVSETQVTVQTLSGGTPTWVNEDNVRWRFSSLRVESAYEFQVRDKLMRLWVGDEPAAVLYCGVELVPGAQQFIGLGSHAMGEDGVIDAGSPSIFSVVRRNTFATGDVGKALWILPTTSGDVSNAGPRVIATVVDDKTVTLTGAAFVADEIDVAWRLKRYEDMGYLSKTQREDAEVYDGSQGYSGLDHLRRALLVEYASGEELDRIGRRHGLSRPRSAPDETWRRLLKVLPYMAKTTVQALEIALEALFPGGGWSVYEDLVNHPCEVFIQTPAMELSEVYRGKAFFEAEAHVSSTSSTSIPLAVEPTTISSIQVQPTEQRLPMLVLPSAEPTDPWAFVTEGKLEGATFALSPAGVLLQSQSSGDALGGRYRRDVPWIAPGRWAIRGWWQAGTINTVGGRPWKLIVLDGSREVCLFWNMASIRLGAASEGSVIATAAWAPAPGTWYHLELVAEGGKVQCFINGELFLVAPLSSFGATVSTSFSFGYVNNGNVQDWTCGWAGVRIDTDRPDRDWANVERVDGVLSSPNALASASNPFVAGDNGRRVRTYSVNNKNDGAWKATYVGAGSISLDGELHTADVQVQTTGGKHLVTSAKPRFTDRDPGKAVTISGSTAVPPNNGTFIVLEIEDEYTASVSKPGGFVTESDLTWKFTPDFDVETVRFEVIDTASWSSGAIAVRDALPAAVTPVVVRFTTIPSAQIVLNEFVENTGEAPELFYPFYLFDVDRLTREIIEAIVAAGVTPRYLSKE